MIATLLSNGIGSTCREQYCELKNMSRHQEKSSAFESIDYVFHDRSNMCHLSAMALLKTKPLGKLQLLQSSAVPADLLPRERVDMIQIHIA